jgi:hypothetical protein
MSTASTEKAGDHCEANILPVLWIAQPMESNETWHAWESQGKAEAEGLAEYEFQRESLLKAIQQNFVPIVHNIRIEAIR